jgi:hypothetical protein
LNGFAEIRSMKKTILRACARAALEQRGYQVRVITRPGVVPGARLNAKKGNEDLDIAVRTSSKRDVTLLRRPDGKWRTIPGVDEVIVAVPAEDNEESIDVFGFEPELMLELFDRAAEVQRKRNSNVSEELPICVALDEGRSKGFGKSISGLKNNAKWRKAVTINASILEIAKKLESAKKADGALDFFERVKREFAERNGVDVSKVTVHFAIND